MQRRDLVLMTAVCVVVSAAQLLPLPRPGVFVPGYDIYGYFYVNVLHALRALDAGGQGILWNPYQSCGQPFFANGLTGLLYPPHLLFVLLGPDAGLRAVAIVNLLIGALGAYALARQLGLGAAAATSGALVFALGNSAQYLTSWSPMHGGPYAWFPAALLFTERLLAGVTLGRVVALGVVLTLALLPGFPQIVLFMYLAIGLRVVWAVFSRECARPGRAIAAVVVALGLPLLLGAVQLFPSLEFTRESIRTLPLPVTEQERGALTWSVLRGALHNRQAQVSPFLPVSVCLVAAALATARRRRSITAFYVVIAVLFFSLAFGPGSPVFDLYARLPVGQMFRLPGRFTWAMDVCFGVLVALGVEVLAAPAASRRDRAAAVALMAAAGGALVVLFPGGLRWPELLALSPLLVAVLALAIPRLTPVVGPALLLAVLLNTTVAPFGWLHSLYPSDPPLFARAADLTPLRARLSPQDRVALITRGADITFMRKTATVFELPAIFDYEPQTSRRYADFFTMLRTRRPEATLADVYYGARYWFPAVSRRLFDLIGTRYVVVEAAADTVSKNFSNPPLQLVTPNAAADDGHALRVYENTTALPRAFYVPRIDVIADPTTLLQTLANGSADLRTVAYVEAPPPSGFVGTAAVAPGEVTFTTDAPELVVLRVHAPQRGFLFLADQYYPGWRASVNGTPTPLLRANYDFRLVEVPAGESVVELSFRPRSMIVGAALSLTTAVVLAALLFRARRARERAPLAD